MLGPLPSNIDLLGTLLKETIEGDSLILATDGSYCPSLGKGSHGWVLASSNKVLWHGKGPSDGQPSILSPYRAELSGILAGLHVIQYTCTYFEITTGTAQLHSDCVKALRALRKDYQGIAKFLIDESDLVVEATSVLHQIPIKVTLQWVKSHYTGPEWQLPHDSNDEAHLLANKFLHTNNAEYKEVLELFTLPHKKSQSSTMATH